MEAGASAPAGHQGAHEAPCGEDFWEAAPDRACVRRFRVWDWAFQASVPQCAQAWQRQRAGVSGAMAAKSFASRHRDSLRFLNGFLAGAVVGAAGAGLTALQLLRRRDGEPHGESAGGRHPPASAGSHVTALCPKRQLELRLCLFSTLGAAQYLVQSWPSVSVLVSFPVAVTSKQIPDESRLREWFVFAPGSRCSPYLWRGRTLKQLPHRFHNQEAGTNARCC